MDLQGLKYLVVGSGFYGSTFAERISSILKEKVLIIEKRKHIGGNSFSASDPNTGIEIHKYGPHIFHTSNKSVWDYINQFSKFNNYRHRVFTKYQNHTYPLPINLFTINQFFGKNFTPIQAKNFILNHNTNSSNNLEEKAISLIGKDLYKAFIYGYTKKQWGIDPKKLPAEIINRLPVRFNYNANYFNDKFEGIPIEGYGKLFTSMTKSSLITIKLDTDFKSIQKYIPKNCKIIYTGAIDQFFNYKFGALKWRGLRFDWEEYNGDYQGTSVMNYSDENIPYTRIHEFSHFTPEKQFSKTLIAKEYSLRSSKDIPPYYPVNTREDKILLKSYLQETKKHPQVHFGGRLGRYCYMDMHQVISQSLNDFKKMCSSSEVFNQGISLL